MATVPEKLGGVRFSTSGHMDNRPLKFEEFEALQNQVIYVSATPADYELEKVKGFMWSKLFVPQAFWIGN